jgi:uncharacterized protein (TIGR03118 family)
MKITDNRSRCLPVIGLLIVLVSGTALAQYREIKLVTNTAAGGGKFTDSLLVNAWGVTYGPTTPLWVANQMSGWSTLYTGSGVAQNLEVSIPSVTSGSPGSPTGIVYNPTLGFKVQAPGANDAWASIFIFATLDGTISGWAPQANKTVAILAVNRASLEGAPVDPKPPMYTGLAITDLPSNNLIFAADVNNNWVDVYDENFNFVNRFTDPKAPAGYGPFGIQVMDGKVFVTFAPASGAPGGFVDVFDTAGVLRIGHFLHGAPLNQPWGIALAPADFGALSKALLVSNNTNSGTINGFNATTGKFVGTVTNSSGKPIVINQLWGIKFGGGTTLNGSRNVLYFTAGPDNNLDGVFGEIEALPATD